MVTFLPPPHSLLLLFILHLHAQILYIIIFNFLEKTIPLASPIRDVSRRFAT